MNSPYTPPEAPISDHGPEPAVATGLRVAGAVVLTVLLVVGFMVLYNRVLFPWLRTMPLGDLYEKPNLYLAVVLAMTFCLVFSAAWVGLSLAGKRAGMAAMLSVLALAGVFGLGGAMELSGLSMMHGATVFALLLAGGFVSLRKRRAKS